MFGIISAHLVQQNLKPRLRQQFLRLEEAAVLELSAHTSNWGRVGGVGGAHYETSKRATDSRCHKLPLVVV